MNFTERLSRRIATKKVGIGALAAGLALVGIKKAEAGCSCWNDYLDYCVGNCTRFTCLVRYCNCNGTVGHSGCLSGTGHSYADNRCC